MLAGREPEVLLLDEMPSGELVTKPPVGVLAHGDPMEDQVAVVEDGVAVPHSIEVVAPQPHHPRRPILVVKGLVAEADGDVAAAGAALVGVGVEIVHDRLRRRARRPEERGENEDGGEPRLPSPSRPDSHP